jgi:hypothetical protein
MQKLKPRYGSPAAPSPSPPGREAGNEVEPPAVFRLAASGSRCWHPRPAPVGNLHADDVVSRLDRDRDRLARGTRAAMPQAIGEKLTSKAATSSQGCPGPSTPSTNARASRARSARPASVTVSRTAPVISATALPCPHPARGSVRAAGRAHTRMHALLGGARQARTPRHRGPSVAVRGNADGTYRPSQLCTPTVLTARTPVRLPAWLR